MDKLQDIRSAANKRLILDSMDKLRYEIIEAGTTKQETAAAMLEAINAFTQWLNESSGFFKGFLQSEEWRNMRAASAAMPAVFEQAQEDKELYAQLLEEFKKTEYKDLTLEDLFEEHEDEAGNITSLWDTAVTNARADLKAAQGQIAEYQLSPAAAIKNPKRHTSVSDVLTNALQNGVKHKDGRPPQGIVNFGAFDLTIAEATKNRPEITAITTIDYSEDPELEKITGYEREILDAVYSLSEEAAHNGEECIFSANGVYSAMPGIGEDPSPQTKAAITKALSRLEGIKVKHDRTDFLTKRNADIESGYYEDRCLQYDKITITSKNHKTTTYYHLLKTPVLLQIAKDSGQLCSVPSKYLNICEVKDGFADQYKPVKMTPARQVIVGYLMRRIEVMKHDRKNKVKKQSNVILFDTLLTDTETMTENKTERKRIRDFILSVLEYWTAAGYISGYKKQTENRTIRGFIILL